VAQAPVWQRLAALRTAYSAAMAHDLARGRTVLVVAEDTFEWQAGRWAHRLHAQRQVVVLFGGWENGPVDETWEYDGRAWTLRQPATRPSARTTRLAHDESRGRTVAFGGQSLTGFTDETWEWDGTGWVQATPSLRPAPRIQPGLAYDVARQRTVLFGGVDPNGSFGDTWSWDGVAWVAHATPTAPSARHGSALALDPVRGRVVLFGGALGGTTTTFYDDTWEWDGFGWTQIQPATRPVARAGAAMAFDGPSGRMLLYGGYHGQGQHIDTWTWDGADWVRAAAGDPESLVGSSVAADHARGVLLMFGGVRGNPYASSNETWTWNGAAWSQQTPPASPSPRGAPLVGDDARQEVLLFGGYGNGPLADTWTWNGAAWLQRFPPVSPPAGIHTLVFDSGRQVVLLCETTSSLNPLALWEWNGTTWSPRPAPTRPSARWSPALAFDDARQRLVLFGGYHSICGGTCSPAVNFAETWLWDGSTWTQAGPATSPPGRMGAGVAYDRDRQRVVLVGGFVRIASGHSFWDFPLQDAWEWDGSTWSSLGAGPLTSAAVFDPAVRRVLAWPAHSRAADVAALTYAPHSSQTYGQGCAGSRGVPWLASNPPSLGNASFALDVGALPATGPCLLGFSWTAASIPVGAGCSVHVGALLTIVATAANTAGFATTAAAIPATPFLRGLTVHVQALALDAGAPAGFSMSSGLRVVVGD
jgi:hypothetical protein